MELRECSQPWFELQISYDNNVGWCCYYMGKQYQWDFSAPLDIEAVWNGEELVAARQLIASNMGKGSGCDGCQWLRYSDTPQFLTVLDKAPENIKKNWRRAIENYEARRSHVDSFPVKYYFNFGVSCNIRCIMCSQEHIRAAGEKYLPAEPLLALKPYLPMADQLHVIGGEPLMIPGARVFLDAVLADPEYAGTMLAIYTNGTLLHQYLDRFSGMNRMNICVSLDSIGATYEHIRRGATWSHVEKNILDFVERGKRLGHDWQATIACVIMKSSISTLDKFVEWCVAHDTPCHFAPLSGFHPADDEDVFKYPELLDTVPGWQEKFDRAIESLKRHGWGESRADSLQKLKADLEKGYGNLKARQSLENMIQVAISNSVEIDKGFRAYITKAQGLIELNYFNKAQEFCNRTAAEISAGPAEDAATPTPAGAYWNQRHRLAALKQRFSTMSDAVDHKTDLNLYQWMQIAAMALEFRPDLILELGRGRGNSTCIFTEVANILGGKDSCSVTSLCLSFDYVTEVVPRLLESKVVDRQWFQPLDCWYTDILAFDYEALLKGKKRVLVFWDAHGFEVAGCMLGRILPQLVEKQHMVLMHDMSDQRYLGPHSFKYNGERLWRGNNWEGPRIILGNINSAVEQAVSITDFSSRNHIELLSADHSNHTEIKPYPERMKELQQLLGDEFFQLQGHWFCFSLNDYPGPFTFPKYVAPEKYLADEQVELVSKLNLK